MLVSNQTGMATGEWGAIINERINEPLKTKKERKCALFLAKDFSFYGVTLRSTTT